MLYTLGFNYYVGYLFYLSVSEGLKELTGDEAKDYYKIVFLKTGPNHFELNGKEYLLTGAWAICLNEKDKITFYKTVEEEIRIIWFRPSLINIKFTFELMNSSDKKFNAIDYQDLFYLRQFAGEAKEALKIIPLNTIDASGIEHKFLVIKELLSRQNIDTWPCRSRAYLFEILFSLARQEDEDTVKNVLIHDGCSKLALDIIYYLQSCYNQKIKVEKLADIFHTNRTTLMNEFKKYSGKSINQYLIELRLMMASTLLRDTELSVDVICERTGFNDISYFSKVFKKGLSCTPSEYRRMHKHVTYEN